MNVLSTQTLHDYREWVKARLAAEPTEDAATLEAALEAYDLTQRDARLEHALKNLQNQYNLDGAQGGSLENCVVGTAGTGYVVGDHGTIAGGGQYGVVTVATVGGSGEILTLSIDGAGQGYDDATAAVTFAGGSGTGTATIDATAITKADPSAKVATILAGL